MLGSTKLQHGLGRLQSEDTPLLAHVLVFLSALTIRNTVEAASTKLPLEHLAEAWGHYYLSYVSLALALVALGHLSLRESPMRTARLVLPFFFCLLIAPCTDLILTRGAGAAINYIYAPDPVSILRRFFLFFGPRMESGVTTGMRVEIAGILGLAFAVMRLKGGSWLRCVTSTVVLYVVIFCYVATPYFVEKMLRCVVPNYSFSLKHVDYVYLLISCLLMAFLAWREAPAGFRAVMRNIRPFRLVHYELMFVMGCIIAGFKCHDLISGAKFLEGVLLCIAIGFAWLFAVLSNDLEDEAIDRISNPGRPLAKGSLTRREYTQWAGVSLVLAVIFAHAVHPVPMFVILGFVANYTVYSIRPLRLKRVPVLSKLAISGNSLLLIVLGFMFAGRSPYEVPARYVGFFLLAATLAMNFIDLKDCDGDRESGIKTLPVLLGMKNAQRIIAAFWFIAHFVFAIICPVRWLALTLVPVGALQAYLLCRRQYAEKPVFLVYLVTLVGVIIIFHGTG